MSKCKIIRSKRRRLCVSDLIHEIQIIDRKIVPPVSGETNYSMDLQNNETIYASCKTMKGVKKFDSTSLEQDVTHRFGIYFQEGVEIDDFIYFNSRYFRILDTEDLDERHEWLLIDCVERGKETVAANYA